MDPFGNATHTALSFPLIGEDVLIGHLAMIHGCTLEDRAFVGLGAIVAEAREVTDRMFLLAARELAASVTEERLATGALYPPVSNLRAVSRRIAIAVAREVGSIDDVEAAVAAAMWWPAYVPYLPLHPTERRRVSDA